MKNHPAKSSARGRFFRFLIPVLLCLSLPWIATGCNDYPLQLLEAKPYAEITDTLTQNANKAVDILFVVDNSGSMKEEQEKLSRNFGKFIEQLTKSDVGNYQIGIVSTDMDSPLERGKLLAKAGQPKIISRAKLSAPQVIAAFSANIDLGVRGTSYEKALDAMRAALSPDLLNDDNGNKGFLRPGALLAVIFIGDEDDCSHNGTIAETELDSEVCRIPKKETLLDDQGKPIPDAKGNPVKGHMEDLTPTAEYITFLKSLKREIVVAGLIGDPVVYKLADPQTPVDPVGGCDNNNQCASGGDHKCIYNSPATRKCGGCISKIVPPATRADADAVPGFRLYDVIKAFGGTDSWFPICGDDAGFQEALLKFAGLIINKLNFVVLTRPPIDGEALTVKVVNTDGSEVVIGKAQPEARKCTKDDDCGSTGNACGQDDVCYGKGWVYYKPASANGQHRIKLSGEAKTVAGPGTTIKVVYATN